MGDASMSQMPDPSMGGTPADPNAMGAPADPAMGGDPNAMGGAPMDPSMGGDPNAMGADPNMDPSMGGAPMDDDKMKKDIQKNIGKGCADFREYQGQDKESLRKWVEGMLDSLDDSDDEEESNPDSIEDPSMAEPQMPVESVILSKKKINEIFGPDSLTNQNNNEVGNERRKNTKGKNTPFNNPVFGK